MKKWLHIIVSLFLVTGMTAGAMAEAAELDSSSCSSAVASVDNCVDFSKQGDDKQPDPTKTSTNCSGCHGHQIGIPEVVAQPPEPIVVAQVRLVRGDSNLPPPDHSDTFRPPIF